MLVQNWMSRPAVTIDADDNLTEAARRLKQHRIHALPVLRRGKLIGLVTDGDLKQASASEATSLEVHELAYLIDKIKMKQIMTAEPVTISFDGTLSEAADLFLEKDIPLLPVIAGRAQMVGVIAPSDISRAFVCMTAAGRKGVEIGLQVKDQPGVTLSLLESVRNCSARIGSVISIDSDAPDGFRHVYLRIYGIEHTQLARLLPLLKTGGRLLFFVDHERNDRNIYTPTMVVA